MIQETPCSNAVLSHHKRLLADALGVLGSGRRYLKNSSTYATARASCYAANGTAALTKAAKEICNLCL